MGSTQYALIPPASGESLHAYFPDSECATYSMYFLTLNLISASYVYGDRGIVNYCIDIHVLFMTILFILIADQY